MATIDPIGKVLFNENGTLRGDDEDIDAYTNLWLMYNFYLSAVASSAQLAGTPEDVFKAGRAN